MFEDRSALRNTVVVLIGFGCIFACNTVQARTHTRTERGDSFRSSLRPLSIGILNFETVKRLKGTLHTLNRDSSDGFTFTLKRSSFVTIKTSRKLEVTLTQGTRIIARNFPTFRTIRGRLPKGTYKVSVRPLGHKKTKYALEFSARK